MAGSTGDRLQAGISAARQGHNQEAKELLAGVVVADPDSELAWLWLGKILSSPDQCAECFRRALAINPENQEAHQLLMDLIRPDLSFMPKTPSGAPAPAAAPSQVFTSETETIPNPLPGTTDEVGNKTTAPPTTTAAVSPFDESPAQTMPATNQMPYVPPFDEPITEGEEELSLEDRTALAAEADLRVMGKAMEPVRSPVILPEALPIAGPFQAPVPGQVKPLRSRRKASGWIFGAGGFLLALLFLGFPAYLVSRNGTALDNLANLIQPSQAATQAVVQPPTSTPGSNSLHSAPVPVVAPSFTPEPPQTYTHRLESVHADVLLGQNLIQSHKYAEAVLVWDKVLAVVPEDGDSHYQRGIAYLDLAELPPRRLDEYKGYLAQARSDLDQAIAIGPVKGEYYLARHRNLIDLALLEGDHTRRISLLESALSDAQNAIKLGILFEKGLDRRPVNAMLAMEQCDQGLNFLLALKKPGKTELVDDVGVKIDLARAYLCKGQVDLAYDQVKSAEKLNPGNRIYWIKALTLYNKGLLTDALSILDNWIKREPYVSSPRYGLKALVHYDLGQIDKAGADLVAAENEGFDLTGLGTYVTARLAIDSGDLTTGAELMADADTYVPPDFGLVARRIHQDYRRVKGQLPQSAPAP